MYEIVDLLDMLDNLKYLHIYFCMKILIVLLLAVGSVLFYIVWVSFPRFKLKIPQCIYSGTIPDDHILDQFLHLQRNIKSYMYIFNIITVLIYLLLYIFHIKITYTLLSVFFSKEKHKLQSMHLFQ